MNNVLNGTSWGETPEPALKVPDFDCWRAEAVIEEQAPAVWQACVDSMQRGRRLRRRSKARQRSEQVGMAALIGLAVFMIVALNLVEVLV